MDGIETKGIAVFKKSISAMGLAVLTINPSWAQSGNASPNKAVATQQTALPGTGPSAKNFDIFGLNAQQVYTGQFLIGGKKCKISGTGVENCIYMVGPQISTVQITGFGVFFNNGKIYAIQGSSAGTNFRLVAEAFEAKYGKPFKVEDLDWKNRAGATFNNVKMSWDFADGIIQLEARGMQIDQMRFSFISLENAPKRNAPSVNF